MTEEQTRRAAQDVIYLAGCAVNEENPDLTRINNTEAVYAYAAQHRLTAAVAMALESAGQKDRRSTLTIANALKRKIVFEKASLQVKEELKKASIWYMPLKGMILKDLYPKPGMREMGDHDILFDADRAEDVKAIMEGLGYETDAFDSSNHDCYIKPPFLRFEMHRALFGPSHDEKLYEYYRDVEKRLLGDGCEKHFSPEDFYLYVTAHEYKHYTGGGTGLRSLLDTYVYLQKTELDMNYAQAEAEKLGMAEFEAQNRSLAQHLFSSGELTEADQEMLEYVMSSGVYGTMEHRVENIIRKNGMGKIQYALHRFFVPVSKKNKDYAAYAGAYPFFYKYKMFIPFLPFYRTFRSIKEGRFKSEARAIKKTRKVRW